MLSSPPETGGELAAVAFSSTLMEGCMNAAVSGGGQTEVTLSVPVEAGGAPAEATLSVARMEGLVRAMEEATSSTQEESNSIEEAAQRPTAMEPSVATEETYGFGIAVGTESWLMSRRRCLTHR